MIATQTNSCDWKIGRYSSLDGAGILSADIPRKVDENGKQMKNVWGFWLDDAPTNGPLEAGRIVVMEGI